MLIGDILRRSANYFSDKDALVCGERVVTYGALNERVNRLADSLLRKGAKKGDRLAILAHNSIEHFEIYFAAAKIGCIFVPVNNLLRQSELRAILDYGTPRVLFLGPDYESIIGAMKEELDYIDFFVRMKGGSLPDAGPYESLIVEGDTGEPEVQVSLEDISSIFFTSGTTGRPKGAMRTHRHEFLNAMTNAVELGLQHDDRPMFIFPFYHIPFVDNTVRHILVGNTIVFRKEGQFDPIEVLDTILRERVTMCQLVPTMINAMLQEEDIQSYNLSHFRLLIYVGSTIPVSVLKKAIETFKCRFMQFYGGTESGPAVTALRPQDHVLTGSGSQLARLASAGRPVLGYEVRIVDGEDRDVPVGELGEIIVKGDAIMVGYWNLPEESEIALRGGWFRAGDMGRFDEEGYLYIVDRKNDMIISGGKNIYPREIEELLYRHEAIMEAAVIGVPDEYWSESVKAVVVLKEGMKASEDEIIAFCKKNLASYKKPRSVEFRKELPKNPTGKILKRLIKEEYWKGRDRMV
ncbi:MAG: long-chain-fatty-acid--CoA ligase [Deltaproteobacteria bacterium]|nr:long-chain-fatty-acid--CoA ligase [Deltaproteobacteria bacterium]